jgi:glycerol-3-phosphate dehydrogenase
MHKLFKGMHLMAHVSATSETVGDLILTCVSYESRNFRFGTLLVSYPVEEALQQINSTVEGYNSIHDLTVLQKKAGVSLPLATFISELINSHARDIKTKFDTFMKTHD